jgi:glycerol dehydrogenase-like iron-containing ADH family enzyme
MMALSDKLAEINHLVHGGKCAYQTMLDNMLPKDREALEQAWDSQMTQRVILRALRSEGYKTSNEAIKNHKEGMCKCPKN